MTKIGWALLMLSTFSLAQGTQGTQGTQPSQQPSQPLVQAKKVQGVKALGGNTPSPGDMYCSGFITTEKVPDNHYIVGGWNSPDQSHFAGSTDLVYIHGPELKEGDRLAIVRRVKDPNRYEFFKGAKSAVAALGQPYFERGYVKVINVQKNVASAVPELSCGDFVPGDLAIPFVEREKPVFRQVAVDRLAASSGKASGRIVMADEFDGMLGSMH